MAGLPATFDIDMIRGDDFAQQFQLLSCDVATPSSKPTSIITEPTVIEGATFTPIDLTGSTVKSQIRKTANYTESLAIEFTVTVDSVTTGLYTLSLTNAQTTTLAMTDSVKYRYDTQVTTAAGKITTHVVGAVTLVLDVTR